MRLHSWTAQKKDGSVLQKQVIYLKVQNDLILHFTDKNLV